MKKVISIIVSMVVLFSIIVQFPAAEAKAETNYSNAIVKVLDLGNEFNKAIIVDSESVKLDTEIAIKQGATSKEIKQAELKVNKYNNVTEEVLTIQPFMKEEQNVIKFDEEAARKANVSEELINSTLKDVELMNSVGTLASCEGQSKYLETSSGFYTYFDSCETDKIIGYIAIGVGLATLTSYIITSISPPLKKASKIALQLVAIGVGSLTVASANGCGIYIKWYDNDDDPYPSVWGSQC